MILQNITISKLSGTPHDLNQDTPPLQAAGAARRIRRLIIITAQQFTLFGLVRESWPRLPNCAAPVRDYENLTSPTLSVSPSP
jgi:hypothetical protein